MGRGLGPTQQKVLAYLQEQWANPSDPYFIGVSQAAVADALASTHSEAQAIRRAIRTLKDRKLIGSANLKNEFDWWLVPVGENRFSTDPRPKAESKMATLRAGITAELPLSGWHSVEAIRGKVLGTREAADDSWNWDRRRQLFNRAIKQLVKAGEVVSIGSTNKKNQSGWQLRRTTDVDRKFQKLVS